MARLVGRLQPIGVSVVEEDLGLEDVGRAARDRRVLAEREVELDRAQLEAEQAKERYREKAEQTDQQRDRLRQAAEALSQRQQALQEEWAAATQARKQAEQTSAELEKQRTRAADQTQKLIDAIAGLDNEPIVMADVTPTRNRGRNNKKNKQHAKRAA